MMNDDKSNRYVIDLRYLYYLDNPRKVFPGMGMSISCRLFSERLRLSPLEASKKRNCRKQSTVRFGKSNRMRGHFRGSC